jgi:hypothetical protein
LTITIFPADDDLPEIRFSAPALQVKNYAKKVAIPEEG